jgi:indole-3-glycerol phosphate synthase
MTDILQEIREETLRRVESSKRDKPLSKLMGMAEEMGTKTGFPFERALSSEGLSLICEVKRASPSKGMIAQEFPYLDIARDYEAAGATCISVLTEPSWFKGDIAYLREISSEVSIPTLRKDFVVDEYMIYEAMIAGASAVLLICSILDDDSLEDYLELCDDLGLSALVEAHDQSEVGRAVDCGARIIGINNRNLHDFTVDLENGIRLRESIPKGVLTVAESGIRDHGDVVRLTDAGFDAALIGETIMRSNDRKKTIRELRFGE